MGLCLYVFDRDSSPDDEDEPEELAECDVGHYSDFACFRDTVARHVSAGSCPTLMPHSDCDDEWTLDEVPILERELAKIAEAFRLLPPEEPKNAFEHTAEYRANARSLYDCFHNVNGENLFVALLDLCHVARENNRPIKFM
jgi:Immunity protein 70